MKTKSFEYARALVDRCALVGALTAGIVTLSVPALAQEEEESAADPFDTESDSSSEDSYGDTEDSSDSSDGSEEAPVEEEAEEPSEPVEPTELSTETSASAEASTETGVDAQLEELQEEVEKEEAKDEKAPVALNSRYIGLELLPATAYPQDPDPGIAGGSLELNINRLQWPYMPKYEGEPNMRVGISGSAWIDSNFRSIRSGIDGDQAEYLQQGRLKLRINPTYNLKNDWFVQASMEFVANLDQSRSITNYVDVDEAWIRLGKWKMGDITIGRQQGFEVYHFGMGLDLNTFERAGAISANTAPAQPYVLNDLWDRGISYGGASIHWYLPKWLRLELLARMGKSSTGNDIGLRPVGVLDFGFIKLKGGYERRLSPSIFKDSESRVEMQGWGGQLQFVFKDWVEGGAGIGHRIQDAFDQDGGLRAGETHTTTTYGGFLNVKPYFDGWLLGAGYHHTEFQNFNYDDFGTPENSTHDQMFGALQYRLWEKLYIKYVFSYSKGHIELRDDANEDNDGFNNESLSHRLRFMVLY